MEERTLDVGELFLDPLLMPYVWTNIPNSALQIKVSPTDRLWTFHIRIDPFVANVTEGPYTEMIRLSRIVKTLLEMCDDEEAYYDRLRLPRDDAMLDVAEIRAVLAGTHNG